MTLCTCGHDQGAHAEEGVGYCFASKPNGDPCECERFHADPAPAEIATVAPIIPDHERQFIEAYLRTLVRHAFQCQGVPPVLITAFLPPDEFGPQKAILFELIYDAGRWFYQADGAFELAGVPGQTWTIPI